jgi:hypothetical protein
MGLLDQLWDDTVAGPRPENGLGKLRKHNTLAARSASGKGTTLYSTTLIITHNFPAKFATQLTRITTIITIAKIELNYY